MVSDGINDSKMANDTQCMDKYSSYPYCYKDIITDQSKLIVYHVIITQGW